MDATTEASYFRTLCVTHAASRRGGGERAPSGESAAVFPGFSPCAEPDSVEASGGGETDLPAPWAPNSSRRGVTVSHGGHAALCRGARPPVDMPWQPRHRCSGAGFRLRELVRRRRRRALSGLGERHRTSGRVTRRVCRRVFPGESIRGGARGRGIALLRAAALFLLLCGGARRLLSARAGGRPQQRTGLISANVR